MTGSFRQTILLVVGAARPDQDAIGRAARAIRQGNRI